MATRRGLVATAGGQAQALVHTCRSLTSLICATVFSSCSCVLPKEPQRGSRGPVAVHSWRRSKPRGSMWHGRAPCKAAREKELRVEKNFIEIADSKGKGPARTEDKKTPPPPAPPPAPPATAAAAAAPYAADNAALHAALNAAFHATSAAASHAAASSPATVP